MRLRHSYIDLAVDAQVHGRRWFGMRHSFQRSLVFLEIWKNEHGQDLIEYAMIAGFIAVVSGMFMPNVARDLSTVYIKISNFVKGAS